MPKATFVKKPCCLETLRKGTEWIRNHFGPDRESYYIAAERQLSPEEWEDFTTDMLRQRSWIVEFVNQDHPPIEGAYACIRVTSPCSEIALLVDPQGYDYVRYAAIESPA